jgi:CRP/FNR family transcriptional regulator
MTPKRPTIPRNERLEANQGTERCTAGAAIVRLPLRRRQRIALQHGGDEHAFLVECGCLTVDAILPGGRRQVILILYPGDAICRSAAPPVPAIWLTAMRQSIVARMRDAGGDAGPWPGDVDRCTSLARLAARSALHAIAIGRLSGEERLASLMLEMALRLGQSTPGGQSFEIPLSRNDMADYLALNPDTLSRLMSRFKARDILSMPARNRAIVRDFDALAGATPLASALRELCQPPVVQSKSRMLAPSC